MTAPLDHISATIGDDVLQQLSEVAAGAAGLTAGAAEVAELHGNLGAGTHLYRISSDRTRERDSAGRWSYVIKIFDLPGDGYLDANDHQDAWNYWKREWLVYQAPWFRTLTGAVSTATCLGSGAGRDGRLWIAIEDQEQHDVRPWPLERFGTVARHFGDFNGRFLSEAMRPDDGWLSRNWLQGWAERSAPIFEQLTTLAANPLVSRIYPPRIIDQLMTLWETRNSLYRMVDDLPHSLCHLDVTPPNMFVVGDDHTIAIDWAFTGIAQLGADLAVLVSSSIARRDIAYRQADELESLCLRNYLGGLQAGGWSGSKREVEAGYLIAGVLHRGIGAVGPILTACLNEKMHPLVEKGFGYPIEKFFESASQLADFWLRRVEGIRAWTSF